ncbi:MAG: hypothetical protein K2Y37_06715 [Pirellulales bacterium]|nr:hypothetical protein [Pirellulales bacterium]
MKAQPQSGYRVWLVGFQHWQPTAWYEIPPRAVAIEPADEACMSGDEATLFVQGFNETTLARHDQIWAIPVPVVVRYEHDLVPGQRLLAAAIVATAPERLKAACSP